MIENIKYRLYFPVAWYFRFFAAIRLKRWKPRIIVVTGSSGKTTLLHLIEAQLGLQAKYSHHANSSFGIPFDILSLERKTLSKLEWISLFFLAPIHIFSPFPKQKFYVVEADCDRPYEGKFLASMLKPEVVLWVNSSKTHSINFESSLASGEQTTIDDAIAFEFGYFLAYCQKLAVINGDQPHLINQIKRTKASVIKVTKKDYLKKYFVDWQGTDIQVGGKTYHFQALLPVEMFYSLEMCYQLLLYLRLPFDQPFAKFILPPGRSSVFEGIKHTVLIDSSYNANLSSMAAILTMYSTLRGRDKWVVIGDMLELGDSEKKEHEKLAELLLESDLDHIILIGDRVQKYTYPMLSKYLPKRVGKVPFISFLTLREALEYLLNSLHGHEAILFKGSQSLFLEGIIAKLLKEKSDSHKLPRAEKFWDEKRKKRGV